MASEAKHTPVDAVRVQEILAEGDGFWRSCTGCHETSEGYSVGHYPNSDVFKCEVGSGCRECGGLGVVWDSTDYGDMADFLAKRESEEKVAATERADLLAKLEQYRKALEEIRDLDRARVRRALAPGEQPNPAAVSLAKAGSIAVAALSTPEQASLPTAQVKG